MTKKDYSIIAAVLAKTRPDDVLRAQGVCTPSRSLWAYTVCEMADALKLDNARFDRSRFIAATEA